VAVAVAATNRLVVEGAFDRHIIIIEFGDGSMVTEVVVVEEVAAETTSVSTGDFN